MPEKCSFFSIAILSNCEIDYLQSTEQFDDLTKVFCNHKTKIVNVFKKLYFY